MKNIITAACIIFISISVFLLIYIIFEVSDQKLTKNDEKNITTELENSFKQWVSNDNPKRAGIYLLFPSGNIIKRSYGGLDLNKKRPVASLSKAVTGLCVAGLIMDKKLQINDKLEDILPKQFFPKNKDFLKNITISHLLTHHAGFYGNNSRKNSEFYQTLKKLVKDYGIKKKYYDKFLPGALSQATIASPGKKYIYSNTNYLILGAVIETVTGISYEDYCSKRVLKPAGVTASLDPNGVILSSYAGWYLSPFEVIKIFKLFDSNNGFLSDDLLKWNLSPKNKTILPDPKIHYGLGTVVSKEFGGNWYYHRGKWNKNPTSNKSAGSLSKSYATMAFYTDEGVGIFAVFEPGHSRKSAKRLRNQIMTSYTRGLQLNK